MDRGLWLSNPNRTDRDEKKIIRCKWFWEITYQFRSWPVAVSTSPYSGQIWVMMMSSKQFIEWNFLNSSTLLPWLLLDFPIVSDLLWTPSHWDAIGNLAGFLSYNDANCGPIEWPIHCVVINTCVAI